MFVRSGSGLATSDYNRWWFVRTISPYRAGTRSTWTPPQDWRQGGPDGMRRSPSSTSASCTSRGRTTLWQIASVDGPTPLYRRSLPGPAPAVPLPPVIPADLLLINACISQSPGSRIQKYRRSKIQSSFNPEQQSDPTNAAITRFTIQSTMRASVQHTGLPTVAGMYKNCTKEESPEIGI